MKKIIISLLTVALVSTGCGKDDYPFDSFGSGDDPFSQQPVSDLTDPALEWSADSFIYDGQAHSVTATITAENPSFTELLSSFIPAEAIRYTTQTCIPRNARATRSKARNCSKNSDMT